jgi:hypothetical protein
MAACIFTYTNHAKIEASINPNGAETQVEQSMSKEKTIFKFNNSQNQNNQATKRALDTNY